ncbi:hypothetical protein [Demequina litorisediminis]|uniref:hypothetical protein n=1 Tax=Demequina litorisediminis TaxID=1849022 RepID=UPI0024E0D337|nr:hypothetical protein [Demequina litorisediminis]
MTLDDTAAKVHSLMPGVIADLQEPRSHPLDRVPRLSGGARAPHGRAHPRA